MSRGLDPYSNPQITQITAGFSPIDRPPKWLRRLHGASAAFFQKKVHHGIWGGGGGEWAPVVSSFLCEHPSGHPRILTDFKDSHRWIRPVWRSSPASGGRWLYYKNCLSSARGAIRFASRCVGGNPCNRWKSVDCCMDPRCEEAIAADLGGW